VVFWLDSEISTSKCISWRKWTSHERRLCSSLWNATFLFLVKKFPVAFPTNLQNFENIAVSSTNRFKSQLGIYFGGPLNSRTVDWWFCERWACKTYFALSLLQRLVDCYGTESDHSIPNNLRVWGYFSYSPFKCRNRTRRVDDSGVTRGLSQGGKAWMRGVH